MTTEEPQATQGSFTRLLWRLVLVLVIIGTVVGVMAILRGRIDKTHAKIILTTYGVALHAGFAMACKVAEARRSTWMAKLGALAAFASCMNFLCGVWLHAWQWPWWWKLMWALFMTSFGCARASLLATAELPARHVWVRSAAVLLALSSTAWFVFLVAIECQWPSFWRALGVLSLLDIGATLAVPLTARAAK